MPSWKDIQPYLDKIGLAIEQIAKGLGIASEHVYYILVRQMVVTGIVYVLGSLIYFFFYGWLVRWYSHQDKRWRVETGEGVILAIFGLGIGGVLAIIAFIVFFCQGLQYILNPEYYAMQNILNFLKTLKS